MGKLLKEAMEMVRTIGQKERKGNRQLGKVAQEFFESIASFEKKNSKRSQHKMIRYLCAKDLSKS